MAVSAEGDVAELMREEVFGGKTSDGFGIDPYGCEPWILMFAKAIHDGLSAGGKRSGGMPVGDAADPTIVTLVNLAGNGIWVDERQRPFRVPLGCFCDAADEIAAIGARPFSCNGDFRFPCHASYCITSRRRGVAHFASEL